MPTVTSREYEHGTTTRYRVNACRCDACKSAMSSYMKDWRRRHKTAPSKKEAPSLAPISTNAPTYAALLNTVEALAQSLLALVQAIRDQ